MTKIKITTTQHIDIEYELATVFDRILAWLIDFIILIGYGLLAWIVFSFLVGDFEPSGLVLVLLPAFFYHLIMEWTFSGQSIGKMALRIKVVRLDGSPPNIGNYLMRWIFRLLETNPILFYGMFAIASSAISEKGQRLGDMLAGTTVIKTARKGSISETIFTRTGANHQPRFEKVALLNDRDATTIKEVLQTYRKENDTNLLNNCANHVCHFLEVVPPDNMNAAQFLGEVLKDYSHMS